ncbi:MAG: metalloregulator ArsR/SmtB family transcription factor [Phycisphaeraceae bacterium]|nr:metalloregulator ArsR/SmtB family transcription factor [Phycisphaeraceae bacterium]
MRRSKEDTPVLTALEALADPVRLRTVRILEGPELAVGEIAKVLQLPQSSVSRHLKTLSDAGLLVKRAAGTAALYRVVMDDMPMAIRAVWMAIRDQLSGPEYQDDARRIAAVLAERRLDSQAFFGRVAGEWDELRNRLFGTGFTARSLLALLSPEWTVADLGCGTGNVTELLAPHVERVVAVDQVEPMLDAARLRLNRATNVQFLSGSLEKLPLKDGAVDAVACVLVLHHIPDPVRAVKEMKRVLRADRGGGVVLIVDMVEHDREDYRHTMGHSHLGFSGEAMTEVLREAGFRSVRVVEMEPDPEGRGPALFAATGRI